MVSFGRVLLVAGVLVGLLGLLRLGRQFPSAAASPGLLVPFLPPVLALALEAGALVALSAGTWRALRQADVGSVLSRWRASLAPVVLFGVLLAVAGLLPRGTERPGAFANDLIRHAQASCTPPSDAVQVPLLGLTVRCAGAARIEGPMPGVRSVQVAMRALEFSDDLRRVRIEGLELSAKRALTVHLRAGTASIRGLAPWTRSTQVSMLARFGLLGAVGLFFWALASVVWVLRGERPDELPGGWRGLTGELVAAVPGMLAAACVIVLDQEQAAARRYGLAALAGGVGLLALLVLARRAPKFLGSFSGF